MLAAIIGVILILLGLLGLLHAIGLGTLLSVVLLVAGVLLVLFDPAVRSRVGRY